MRRYVRYKNNVEEQAKETEPQTATAGRPCLSTDGSGESVLESGDKCIEAITTIRPRW